MEFADAVVRPRAHAQWLGQKNPDAIADWYAALAELRAEADARETRLLAIAQSATTPTTMRFYESARPEVGDVVMGEIERVSDYGVFVRLSEYDGLEGYAQLNHMKRGRVRAARQVAREGQTECFEVSEVSERQISLSKVAVTAAAKEAFLDTYHAAKKVHDVLRHLAEEHRHPNLNAELGWPDAAALAALLAEEGGFERLLGPDAPELCAGLRKATQQKVVHVEPTEIRRYLEVTCFEYAGINAIKQALRCALAVDPCVKVNLVKTPTYCVEVTHDDKATAEALAQRAVDAIRADILASKGNFKERLTREQPDDVNPLETP